VQSETLQRYAQLMLRLGLGVVFLIFGLDKFRSEDVQFASWADWVPGWFSLLIGGRVKALIYVLGVFEVLAGFAIVSAPRGMRRQGQRLQLGEAALSHQRVPESEALVERDRVPAIFDHGADADESVAVGEQRAQVARGGVGNPDRREAVMLEQVEQMASVTPVRLGLADDHGADLDGLAHEQCVAQALHQGVEPESVASAFDAHRDGAGQRGVEPLDRIAGMLEFSLDEHFSRCRVEDRDLLLPRVQVASHQCHELGLLLADVVVIGSVDPTSNARPFS
jgi:hypothetical protein